MLNIKYNVYPNEKTVEKEAQYWRAIQTRCKK